MHAVLTALVLSFILYLPQLHAAAPTIRTPICMLAACVEMPPTESMAPDAAPALWLPSISR